MRNVLKWTLAVGLVLASAVPGFTEAFTVVGVVNTAIDTGDFSFIEGYIQDGTTAAGTEICVQDTTRAATDPLAMSYVGGNFFFTTQFDGIDLACAPSVAASTLCILGGWNEGGTVHNGWVWNDARELSGVAAFFDIGDDNPSGMMEPTEIPTATCTEGDTRLGLTWAEPATGDPSLGHHIGWNIYRVDGGSGADMTPIATYVASPDVFTVPAGSPQYIDTGLMNGQEYCYALTPVYFDNREAPAHTGDASASQGVPKAANLGSDVCCTPTTRDAVFGSVSAVALRKVNRVDWTTTLEDGTIGFVVEVARSSRGPWFPMSDTIPATGAGSAYSWRHTGLDLSSDTTHFYRVREVSSMSGAATVYSDVVSVDRDGSGPSVVKGPKVSR